MIFYLPSRNLLINSNSIVYFYTLHMRAAEVIIYMFVNIQTDSWKGWDYSSPHQQPFLSCKLLHFCCCVVRLGYHVNVNHTWSFMYMMKIKTNWSRLWARAEWLIMIAHMKRSYERFPMDNPYTYLYNI